MGGALAKMLKTRPPPKPLRPKKEEVGVACVKSGALI